MNLLEVRKGYADLIGRWDWEFHLTLTFGKKIPFESAFKEVKKYLGRISRRNNDIRFAGLIFLSNPNNTFPHIHCVLMSDPNYPRTLKNIPRLVLLLEWKDLHGDFWEKQMYWRYRGKTPFQYRMIRITTNNQWNAEIISYYIAKPKNIILRDPDRWEFQYYRPELLKKLRRCPDSG